MTWRPLNDLRVTDLEETPVWEVCSEGCAEIVRAERDLGRIRIHGDDPVLVFQELSEVIDEVIAHFQSIGKELPQTRTRPMMEVAL